jgi:hypothetical protein
MIASGALEDGKWQEERESIEKNIQLVCRWGVCSYMDDVGCLGFDQVLSNISVDAKTVIIMKNTGMVKVGCAAIIASTFSWERYTERACLVKCK